MRELRGAWKALVGLLVAFWSFFLIYTALTVALHPVLQGSISLSFGLALVFLLYPLNRRGLIPKPVSLKDKLIFGKKDSPSLLDILLAIAALIPCVYLMFNWGDIARTPGYFETYHLVLGAVLAVCLLEGTRRSLGMVIPIVVFLFIFYAFAGQYIPGRFGHPGFKIEEILYQLYLMTEGIWGLLTDLTSRVIALFLIFGPVLFATGVGKAFMDLARFTGGRIRGGAAQIAVISSAFFGMLSGSAVANVATTGAFTIPTMKRLGYRSEFAGAVEASASSGGQIMPPIMGAGAFVMAEFLGIPYLLVMIAAIIPAIIYFVGVGCGVWVEATKAGLGKLPPELMPKVKEVFAPRQILTFILPVGVLVYLLIQYLPPQYCAAWGLITAMIYFLLFGGRLSSKGVWERIKTLGGAFYSGVTSSLAWLMVMMSCVQMAVCMISLTGFGVKVSELILDLAGAHIILALIATMVTAMILGMGMTTTAAYVIAAAVLGPALIGMGIPALAGHLFIFYYAIISGLTPPVCIAVFTAAAIAGGNWLRMAWISIRLGIAAYVIPFFFVFEPAYLMEGDLGMILLRLALASISMFFIAVGTMGYFLKPDTIWERFLFTIGGIMLLHPNFFIVGIGFLLIALGWLSQRFLPPIPVLGTRPPHSSK